MANPRFNKQVAQPRGMKVGGRVKKMGGGMSTARKDMASGYYKDDMGMKGGSMYKKGGSVKKKQGYKDRKDESIAMRIKKKRTKKQLRASANESYGKFGSKAKKSGKINKQFMARQKFIQKAIKKPGALRKSLGIKKGEKIPASKLKAAAKKKGKLGQRARFAMTLNKLRKKS